MQNTEMAAVGHAPAAGRLTATGVMGITPFLGCPIMSNFICPTSAAAGHSGEVSVGMDLVPSQALERVERLQRIGMAAHTHPVSGTAAPPQEATTSGTADRGRGADAAKPR